ncbi:MAG: CHAT domain-containing protein [SAR324 cluster bacterium]|nr:CHAT domain-containing protein [SAR324 cluster bacterium]
MKFTPLLREAWLAHTRGNGQQALMVLLKIEQSENNKKTLWYASFLKVQVLTFMGRISAALTEIQTTEKREIELLGFNWSSRALRGEARVWIDDYAGALQDFQQVLEAIGSWEFPVSYALPPSNLFELILTSSAKARSYIGMSALAVRLGQYESARKWAQASENLLNRIHYVRTHPLYGTLVFKLPDSYYGRGLSTTMLAASTLVLDHDFSKAEALFQRAESFFQAGGYEFGKTIAGAIHIQALVHAGALPEAKKKAQEVYAWNSRKTDLPRDYFSVPLPRFVPLSETEVSSTLQDLPNLTESRLGPSGLRPEVPEGLIPEPPIRPRDSVLPFTALPSQRGPLPKAGEKGDFGVLFTPDLEVAYQSYFNGEADLALKHLKQQEQHTNDPLMLWYVSFLRAQVLAMSGLTADAETELIQTSTREIVVMGANWNARALRGEIRVWMGDYSGAIRDFMSVIQVIGSWRFPTSYVAPPSNLYWLNAVAAAQNRAFIGMSAIAVRLGHYELALKWADEAEQQANSIQYVANHPLYGRGVFLLPDSFYGRAINMTMLGGAHLVVSGKANGGDAFFKQAREFYQAVGYAFGDVIVGAIQSQALLHAGFVMESESLARKTAGQATDLGAHNLTWQIEVLRGKALLRHGQNAEAELAFRHAQTSVELLAGTLASDTSRLRFGAGKEDITWHLAQLDLERKDYEALFRDLERGRARAFSEMLAQRPLELAPENSQVINIRKLDAELRRLRLRQSSPGKIASAPNYSETALLNQRQSEVDQLRKTNPELADIFSVATVTLKETQAGLKQREMVAYALPQSMEEPLRFMIITRDFVKIVTTKLTRADMKTGFDLIRKGLYSSEDLTAIEERGIKLTTNIPSGEPNSFQQGVTFLEDRLNLATWGERNALYVVPSGNVYFIPWGALDINYPVALLPLGGWLVRKPQSLKVSKSVVILGDPEFGGDLIQLPGARQEAIELAKYYQTEALLGENATEAALRTATGSGVNILHLATHGVFSVRDPLQSSVFLTLNHKAVPLTAKDLFEHPLRARRVILSACETGLGKNIAGDDMLGLVRSFYLGGTVTILSSLWNIEDEGTRLFMETWHEYLGKMDYGQAWMMARNTLKQTGFAPSVYGAFILGGNMRE